MRQLVAFVLIFMLSPLSMGKAKPPAKSALCATCHQKNGMGTKQYPQLAGKKKDDLKKAIKDFKSGARKNAQMESMVKHLSDKEIEELADYFSKLK